VRPIVAHRPSPAQGVPRRVRDPGVFARASKSSSAVGHCSSASRTFAIRYGEQRLAGNYCALFVHAAQQTCGPWPENFRRDPRTMWAFPTCMRCRCFGPCGRRTNHQRGPAPAPFAKKSSGKIRQPGTDKRTPLTRRWKPGARAYSLETRLRRCLLKEKLPPFTLSVNYFSYLRAAATLAESGRQPSVPTSLSGEPSHMSHAPCAPRSVEDGADFEWRRSSAPVPPRSPPQPPFSPCIDHSMRPAALARSDPPACSAIRVWLAPSGAGYKTTVGGPATGPPEGQPPQGVSKGSAAHARRSKQRSAITDAPRPTHVADIYSSPVFRGFSRGLVPELVPRLQLSLGP